MSGRLPLYLYQNKNGLQFAYVYRLKERCEKEKEKERNVFLFFTERKWKRMERTDQGFKTEVEQDTGG